MVLLTMTAAIVEALNKLQAQSTLTKTLPTNEAEEPSLSEPAVSKPISHGQIIAISTQMKSSGLSSSRLDYLLRGSQVYISPPPPKPEPTSEYKILMARLRREEESRVYERMINPEETFYDRFPTASATHAFSSTAAYAPTEEDEEMTFSDINRQVMLIFNVFISVFACGAAIWMVGRWWSTPARLALSMSGALLVGVAEVVVYSGYIRRLTEAKGKEKGVKEVKEIIKTWVVGDDYESPSQQLMAVKKEDTGVKERKRRKDDK